MIPLSKTTFSDEKSAGEINEFFSKLSTTEKVVLFANLGKRSSAKFNSVFYLNYLSHYQEIIFC